MKTRACWLPIPLLLLLLAGSSHAATTGALTQELARSRHKERGVVSVWWLPVEYWLAAAGELKQQAEEIDTVRKLFRNYLIIAVLDASLDPEGKLHPATHADIGPRIEIRRNGTRVEILRDIDPRVARRVAELSYLLKTSLGVLGPGLRIFFLPNIDDKGRPLLHGSSNGTLTIRYEQAEDEDPLEYLWHAPLTSVAGPIRCPEGGEELEAHFKFCPWHGVKARGE